MGCSPEAEFSSKKKSHYAQEQDTPAIQELRVNYIECAEEISPENLIFIDESGAHLGMSTEYGRGQGGHRVKTPKPFNKHKKFSIIGAISMTGIESIMYIESATDGDIFLGFLKDQLTPKLKPGQYVVMDNVKFHKSERITSLIESTGAKAVFLPPYSPDLSPIEKMWSKMKGILKKLMPRDIGEFHSALSDAIYSITPENCEEWYQCCGYTT